MKILVVTPLYYIEGREMLYHDTNAVHYLIKYWTNDNEILVCNTYIEKRITGLLRFFKRQEREYFKNGYSYAIDGIKINLVESLVSTKFFKRKIRKSIDCFCLINNFIPDVIICHFPNQLTNVLPSRFKNIYKVAVLHEWDITSCKRYFLCYRRLMKEKYNKLYCRSKSIYEYFKNRNLNNLSDSILYSGQPSISCDRSITEKPKCFTILYCGKLIRRKNICLVVKTLNKLKKRFNFKLNIYGEGKEKNRIKKLCKKYSLDYQINGYISRDEVLQKMKESDIFVMPSIKETLGLVYLESMSQGCIPIGTIGEGIDGIIENNRNGFLVEPNERDLKNCFVHIFEMKDKNYIEIANNAMIDSKIYNEKDMSIKYYTNIKNDFVLHKHKVRN